MALDRPSPDVPAHSAEARLVTSTAALLTHLQECEICREVGVAHCSIVDQLAHIVRSDRRHLIVG